MSKSVSSRLIGRRAPAVLLVTALLLVAVPAQVAFAASVHVQSVTVGGPSGTVTYGTPGDVAYVVEVLCAGTGTGITVTPTVSSILPSGVTGNFSPGTITWGNGCGSAPNPQTTTLTLHTTAATPGGVSAFTVSVGGVNGGGSLTVNGIALTVVGFAAYNKVYNGNTIASPNLTGVTLSAGVIYPDVATLNTSSVGASFSDKFVGNGKLVTSYGFALAGAQASNYSLTQPTTTANITKADLNITVQSAEDKVYDATTAATVTLGHDAVQNDSVTVSGVGTFADKHYGLNKQVTVPVSNVSLSGPDAANYNVVTTSAVGYADIYKRPITVTAVTDTRAYNGNANSSGVPTVTLGGIQGSDTAGFTQAFNSAAVGTGKTLTPTGSVGDGNGGANYDVTFVPVYTGVINALALDVTASDTIDYGGAPSLPPQYDGFLAGEDATDLTTAPTCTAGAGPFGVAGSPYTVTCSGGVAANYTFNYVAGSLTVNPVTLTATADDQFKLTTDPALVPADFTFSYSGFVLGEDGSDLITEPVCDVAGDQSVPGTLPIVCSGGASDNYLFSYVDGTLTISAAEGSTTLYAQKAFDGWVRELSENSTSGGLKNRGAKTIRIGDSALNQQYRGILSFDTSQIPSNASIQGATLRFKLQKVSGKPWNGHGNLVLDVRNGPFLKTRLQLKDFNTPASVKNAATIANTPVDGWYSVEISHLTGQIKRDGVTQFRIRFATGDDNDLSADLLKIFSGNSTFMPELVIDYSIP